MISQKRMNIKKRLSNFKVGFMDELVEIGDLAKTSQQFNEKTIFSGKSIDEIVDTITLSLNEDTVWDAQAKELIRSLTEVFMYWNKHNKLVLSPSIYIEHLNLGKAEELARMRVTNEKYEEALQPLRSLLNTIDRSNTDFTRKNEHFGFIALSADRCLRELEKLKVQNSEADSVALANTRNSRVGHARFRNKLLSKDVYANVEDNKLSLIYKHLVKTSFEASAGTVEAQHTTFEGCNIWRSTFSHSSFEWCQFIDTSIKQSVFSHSKFFDIDLSGLKDTESAVFVNCRIMYCNLTDCKALFIDCEIEDCQTEGLRIISTKETLKLANQ